MAYVYWITDNPSENILKYGYIGITKSTVEKRIKGHKTAYRAFLLGKKVGCYKLFREVKDRGGWTDSIKVIVICEADIEYCIQVENKLRPLPNTGWNIRVGGDYHIMFKREITQETKDKLAFVRKSWVMSQETRERVSKNRLKEGNPMFGVLPWDNPASTEESKIAWLYSHLVYYYWLQSDCKVGVRTVHKHFSDLNYWSLDSMIRKFRIGWIPEEDTDWLKYKESNGYD